MVQQTKSGSHIDSSEVHVDGFDESIEMQPLKNGGSDCNENDAENDIFIDEPSLKMKDAVVDGNGIIEHNNVNIDAPWNLTDWVRVEELVSCWK